MMHGPQVGLRHSSCEADEQSVALCCGAIHSRAIRCGAGGAKGGDRGMRASKARAGRRAR